MRVMVIVKADKSSEAGILPDKAIFEKMGKYNEELVKAGIMLAAEGLQASSKGKRVKFSGEKRTITDGPFAETKELIAGFWLWQVRSMDEAVEWLKRAPFDGGTEVEIRRVFEAEDFGENLTPELREPGSPTPRADVEQAGIKMRTQPTAAGGRVLLSATPCSSGTFAPSVCLCVLCGKCSPATQPDRPSVMPIKKVLTDVESNMVHSS